MKKTLLSFIVLLIVFVTSSTAQVSVLLNPTYGYTFTNSAGTYTPLSGGTVYQSGSAISTDAVSTAITLPFTFTYNGIRGYSSIFISNNGFITFGIAPGTTNYTPLSITTAGASGYDGAIAGTAMNCVASTASGAAPEISYGSNGAGDFVVQYTDIGQSGFTAIRMTYQIILKSDGKTVQIVYGPNNVGVASASQCQVGLRGTNDEDWNNRTLSSGGNWNTAGGAAGTASTSGMSLTATTTLPASGRTFQWAPTSYTPTYLVNPGGVTQDFTTWVNGAGPNNVPSTNWASNGYGNASWQIDNNAGGTTSTGWTSVTSYMYTPADYANASGGRSARFHSGNSNSPQVGYLDYYVDMSSITGTATLDFYSINTSGTDKLQIFMSTDGGSTFSQLGADIGVNATWTALSRSLGTTNSATTILRFKATADFGSTDIGLDRVVVTPPPALPTISGISSSTLCANGGQTITITGTNFAGSSSVQFNGVNASSYTVVNNTSITAVSPSGVTDGVITVTNAAGSASSGSYTVVSNPTVAVSPTSGSFCSPGGTAVALGASGASTYTWLPTSGLDASSGANVNASPANSTTYTVTGTDANGCTASATSSITVTLTPSELSATATPSTICNGGTTNLLGSGYVPTIGSLPASYTFTGSTGTYTPITGTTLSFTSQDDASTGNLPIGFTFNYNNINQTVFAASTNGLLILGQTTNGTGLSGNALATTANTIAPLWDDNNMTGGSVQYLTTGSSPNRILTVQWTGMHVGGSGSTTNPTINMQCKLYEGSNKIEFIYGSTSATLVATASIGISGAAGNYRSVTPLNPANTSTVSSSTENTSISSAANFPSGTVYTFKQPAAPLTYAWLPAANLNDATLANPSSTGLTATTVYTVTVSNGSCSATTTISVDINPLSCTALTLSGANACVGNQSVSANPSSGGTPYTYSWTEDGNAFGGNTQSVSTSTGTHTYECTVTDACGSICTQSLVVITYPYPTVTSTPSTSTLCGPGSVTLVGGGAASYTWSGGISDNVAFTASSTTTYTVTGTTNGCSSTATALVTVNPAVTGVTANASNTTICAGGQIDLTSSANAASPILLSEGFESGASGWLLQDSSTTGASIANQIFRIETAPFTNSTGGATFLNYTMNGSKFVYADADAGGSGSSTRTNLVSPSFSTIGYSGNATLYFKNNYRYYSTGAEKVQVQISKNGGASWTNIIDYNGASIGNVTNNAQASVVSTLTIPADFMNEPDVKLRWAYRSNWGYFWAIDSIQVIGTPISNTYSWTSSPSGFTSSNQNESGITPSTTTTYSVTVSNSFGCTSSSAVTVTVNPIALSSIVGTYTNATNIADGGTELFKDASCNLIATVADASGGNVLGSTTATQVLASSLDLTTVSGRMLSSRSVEITPTTNGPATVTLYFTQADFDEYNNYNTNTLANYYLPLPANPTDPAATYFRVMKVVGTTPTGTLQPLVWDATSNLWSVTFTETSTVAGKYTFYTMPSCANVSVSGFSLVSVTSNSAVVNWTAVTNPPTGWYSFQYENVTDNPGVWVNYGTINNSFTSNTLVGLIAGKTYNVQIRRHCNSQSEGPWSTSVNFTTPSSGCDPLALNAVQGITFTNITGNTANVSWTAVPNATWYTLRYREVGSTVWLFSTSTNTNTILTGLNPSSDYELEARANCSALAPGIFGSYATFMTAAACGTPTGLASSPVSSTKMGISWTAVSGAGWYNVRYRIQGNTTWIVVSSTPASTTLANLTPASTYEYQVLTKCSATNISAWSSMENFTTPSAKESTTIEESVQATQQVTIYPNPTRDVLNIEVTSAENASTVVKVFDMSGRLVKQVQANTEVGVNNLVIDLNDVSTGMYTVQVYENNKLTNVTKVTKQD